MPVWLQPGAVDINDQLLAPGGKGPCGSWGKGSSGGSGAKPASVEQGKTGDNRVFIYRLTTEALCHVSGPPSHPLRNRGQHLLNSMMF